ncbi:MAG: amidase family protein, partial [Armatimonadota bacterium]
MTASEINDLVLTRKASVTEVAQAHLDRIAAHDGDFGAFLTVNPEHVLAAAAEVQKRVDEGLSGPMVGVPVALKDNISTKGIRTTCASKILENYVPPFDATTVLKMQESGLVMVGKTNLDEFAMGTSCENSALGTTHNPWDTDLVPGGSSGGSAVAVSAEMAAVSLGSDTGGSIRLPAALTGTVGFKPTYGRVSRYGLIAFGSSLDQIGPFARNVEDAARLAHVLTGHDPLDSTSLPGSQISLEGLKTGSVKGKKIALPKELFSDAIDPAVMDVIQICIDALKREGCEFHEVSLPSIQYGVTTYYIIAPAEASSNLGRFDGIRFGPRIDSEGHVNM